MWFLTCEKTWETSKAFVERVRKLTYQVEGKENLPTRQPGSESRSGCQLLTATEILGNDK